MAGNGWHILARLIGGPDYDSSRCLECCRGQNLTLLIRLQDRFHRSDTDSTQITRATELGRRDMPTSFELLPRTQHLGPIRAKAMDESTAVCRNVQCSPNQKSLEQRDWFNRSMSRWRQHSSHSSLPQFVSRKNSGKPTSGNEAREEFP